MPRWTPVLTNYFNWAAQTEIDLPEAERGLAAAA